MTIKEGSAAVNGKQIKTLEELNTAAKNRQAVISVIFDKFSRPMPAAVLLNMSGNTILCRIRLGVYVYEKHNKVAWWPSGFSRKEARHE